MKKMSIILIISVLFLLSTSPINAQLDELIDTSKNNPIGGLIVDQSIKLNSNRIHELQIITKNIENIEYRLFLNRVIEELKIKGNLNANDIKSIAKEFEFTSSWIIRPGFLMGMADCETDYGNEKGLWAFGIPLLPRPIIEGVGWRGPGLFLTWDCSKDIMFGSTILDFLFNLNQIHYNHRGLALFQFGFWIYESTLLDWATLTFTHSLWMRFFSPFIIISPDI